MNLRTEFTAIECDHFRRVCGGREAVIEMKHIISAIHGEIEDAERYAKCATRNKDIDRPLADTYYRLSSQELEHANALHEQAVRMIREYGEEPPAAMKAVWDWEHDRLVEQTAAIKTLLAIYRE